jgi:hypothetical protein
MTTRRRSRQVLAVAAALAVVAGVLWYRSREPVMSGTKATFSFVGVKAAPAGGPGGNTTTTSTTSTTTTTTTATEGR